MKYIQCYQSKKSNKDGIILSNHLQERFFLNVIESELYEYFNGVNTIEQIAHATYLLLYNNLSKDEFIETFNSFVVYLITNFLLKPNN